MKRLSGLDVIRGFGIIAVVFLHSATFHYEGITAVDFDNPPLLITVIGFLLMWAGLFAIVSATAYAYSATVRLDSGQASPRSLWSKYGIAGGLILVLHYLYFIVLAPKLLDVVAGNHQYALLPGLIASGRLPPVHLERVFYSTTLSMLAWNLILIGPLLWALFRRDGHTRTRRYGAVLGGLGTAVMALSLLRIPLYPLAERAIAEGNVLSAVFWGFVVNKNNPILPYLGFGLFGTWLGLALARSPRPRRVLGAFAGMGALWLAVGLIGLFSLPTTMLEREVDLYWYFITLFQLGLFLLLTVAALAVVDYGRGRSADLARALAPIRRLGMVSLTIFYLETLLSQALVRLADALFPGWSLEIGLCLAFGAFNGLLWIGIVALWARLGFRFSMEWLTVRLYALLGRPSEKIKAHDLLRPPAAANQ